MSLVMNHPGAGIVDAPLNKLGDSAQSFARMKQGLVGPDGASYISFRSTLTPKYARVWAELGLAYLVLLAISAAALAFETAFPYLAIAAAIPLAVVLGYLIHFLSLFHHAASHHNLSSDPKWNDRLANLFLGVLLAFHIKGYRALHLRHHKWHGTADDPENSYIRKPGLWYFVKWLTGYETIRKLLGRSSEPRAAGPTYRWFMLFSLGVHAAGFLLAVYLGYVAFAFAWALSIGIFYPLFSDLRVIMEHRRADAASEDYQNAPHGAFSRMFRGNFFAHTFGGAGFDRHLLHHLDPSVPFERLGELDTFLRSTNLAGFLEQRTTTYPRAAHEIMKA